MPSRLTEIWQARERVREGPPTDEMLVALFDILMTFYRLNHPGEGSGFNVLFNDKFLFFRRDFEKHSGATSLFIQGNLADESFPPGSHFEIAFGKVLSDGAIVFGHWKYFMKERGEFDITPALNAAGVVHHDFPSNKMNSQALIDAVRELKNLSHQDPRFQNNYPLRRVFDQFDLEIYQLDHKEDPATIEELIKIIETFSRKFRALIKQLDSFKIALTESRQATAAAEAKAVAAESRIKALEARAEAAEAKLAGFQYLTEGFEDWDEEEAVDLDLELELDDEETPSGDPDALPGMDAPSDTEERPFLSSLRVNSAWMARRVSRMGLRLFEMGERLSLRGMNLLSSGLYFSWLLRAPLGLLALLGIARCGDRYLARNALADRQAVEVLVRDDGVNWDDLISVLYRDPFIYGDYNKPKGSYSSTPLNEADIQEGGDFYYGALAMELLERNDSFSIQGYAATRDPHYEFPTPQLNRRFFNYVAGFPPIGDPVILNGTYRRLGPGAFGVENFAWIYWGFAEGIHDRQMTIGHQLVLAALLRYPWYNDSDLFNRQDDEWKRIKDRATQALNGLIKEGKIHITQRTEIAEQIEAARPWSWQYLDETFGRIEGGTTYASTNPGEEFRSIYDFSIDEAARELWTYKLNHRDETYWKLSDLRGEFDSMTLTLDPDIQARVMRTEMGEPPDDYGFPYESGTRIMVINDAGEIVGFSHDKVTINLNHEPTSYNLAYFEYSSLPRNWAFDTPLGSTVYITPETFTTSCYVSSQWSHDLLGLITGLRTGQPLPRPHIAHSFYLLNGNTFDMSAHWAATDNADSCAEELYADGENYQNLLDRLEPLSAGGHPYYMISRSHKRSSERFAPAFDSKLHVAWTTVENGPTYTLIMRRPPFPRESDELLIESILEGIHDAWAERQATVPN